MSNRFWRLIFIAAFTAVIATLLIARQRELGRLRAESARLRPAPGTLAALQQAKSRLESARPSGAELTSLQADHATIARMRNEIAAIERSADARERSAKSTPPSAPTLLDEPLAADQWRNAGRTTPAAATETLLWAAASGDAGALSETLMLDSETRTKAEALLASLPSDLQQEFSTAERLVGLLTAKDISAQSAQVMVEMPQPQGTMLVLNLENLYGQSRNVALSLRTDGTSWRVVVPPAAIDSFAARARQEPGALHLQPLKVN